MHKREKELVMKIVMVKMFVIKLLMFIGLASMNALHAVAPLQPVDPDLLAELMGDLDDASVDLNPSDDDRGLGSPVPAVVPGVKPQEQEIEVPDTSSIENPSKPGKKPDILGEEPDSSDKKTPKNARVKSPAGEPDTPKRLYTYVPWALFGGAAFSCFALYKITHNKWLAEQEDPNFTMSFKDYFFKEFFSNVNLLDGHFYAKSALLACAAGGIYTLFNR